MANELEHSHTPESIRVRISQTPPANYLRDWVYGGIDGAITSFTIVSGVVGADLASTVVLVLGLANLFADGLAMAASNYSGTKAEHDNFRRLLAIERKHIAVVPEGEREEVRQIFAAKGFAGGDLERVVAVITADEENWAKIMATEEYGLAASPKSPLLAGLSTFAAFVICGSIPLLGYLITNQFLVCVAAAGSTFFTIGTIKSRWSLASWWWSAIETLVIGMTAASIAFGLGFGLSAVLHLQLS